MSGSSHFSQEEKTFKIEIESGLRIEFENWEDEREYHDSVEKKYTSIASELIPIITTTLTKLQLTVLSDFDPSLNLNDVPKEDGQAVDSTQPVTYYFTFYHISLEEAALFILMSFKKALSFKEYQSIKQAIGEEIANFVYSEGYYDDPTIVKSYGSCFTLQLHHKFDYDVPIPSKYIRKQIESKIFEQLKPKIEALMEDQKHMDLQIQPISDYSGPSFLPKGIDQFEIYYGSLENKENIEHRGDISRYCFIPDHPLLENLKLFVSFNKDLDRRTYDRLNERLITLWDSYSERDEKIATFEKTESIDELDLSLDSPFNEADSYNFNSSESDKLQDLD